MQLAMPPGGEDGARAFYAGVLGIPEVPKPPALAGRGGCWFEAGAVRVHVGVDDDFRPARKAHPALGRRRSAPRSSNAPGSTSRWADEIPGVVRGLRRRPVRQPHRADRGRAG